MHGYILLDENLIKILLAHNDPADYLIYQYTDSNIPQYGDQMQIILCQGKIERI